MEYPKIQSIFKRDEKTHKFLPEFSRPEFAYLSQNRWVGTEKVDGTNIRVMWSTEPGTDALTFGGKTDNASIPPLLLKRLHELFTAEQFRALYPATSMTLYGEGYGAKIQKGGGNYKPDGQDFVLFDVLIDGWWLERENIRDVAAKLGINLVPIVFEGTLGEAVDFVRGGFPSQFGNAMFDAEGLVLKPAVALHDRRGERVITKVKTRDFQES